MVRREAFEASFEQALSAGKFHLETCILPADQETRWVVAEGRLYRDEHGNTLKLAGTIRDVTAENGRVAIEVLRRPDCIDLALIDLVCRS